MNRLYPNVILCDIDDELDEKMVIGMRSSAYLKAGSRVVADTMFNIRNSIIENAYGEYQR